jgi:hypothetical protein
LYSVVWYWLLDAGGPVKRHEGKCERRDFLFPQFGNQIEGWEKWNPNFVDYLFLAFSTSTTFGPTDTMVLSRRVKNANDNPSSFFNSNFRSHCLKSSVDIKMINYKW